MELYGGLGNRGTEGMILAAQYARVHKIPYLGICLGMQMAIVEFARHVLGYEDANSIELAPETTHPVIALMPDQEDVEDLRRNPSSWKLSVCAVRRLQIL